MGWGHSNVKVLIDYFQAYWLFFLGRVNLPKIHGPELRIYDNLLVLWWNKLKELHQFIEGQFMNWHKLHHRFQKKNVAGVSSIWISHLFFSHSLPTCHSPPRTPPEVYNLWRFIPCPPMAHRIALDRSHLSDISSWEIMGMGGFSGNWEDHWTVEPMGW